MRCLFALSLLLLAACPPGSKPDAGAPDAYVEPPACASPQDCKLLGYEGVCRAGKCAAGVLCADDVECGLGESCLQGSCAFTGCTADSECGTGRCRFSAFACAECASSADCPSTRPVCDATNKCVQCGTDDQCPVPGPAHCDAPTGACVHCLEDKHCPNGLSCGAGHVCTGAQLNALCPMGITCGAGLLCVGIGGVNRCLPGCSLANPTCATGEICFKLTYAGGTAIVFDQGGPLGVCFASQPGLKGYRESCTRTASSSSASNCQPNLTCIPDSANVSICRTFCDLNSSGGCSAGEKCHPFSGDYSGRLYGVCYPDTHWGDVCEKDSSCKTGQACTPYEDANATYTLSNICQYSVGPQSGLSPCKDTALADGGLLKADRLCQSGSCQADPLSGSLKYFCYAGCKRDQDCSVGGRTGSCDGEFVFPVGASTGKITGCRPGCTSSAGCAEYGPQMVCRSRFDGGFGGYDPSFHASCAPAAGALLGGAACTADAQCRSGFCLARDGRGVSRSGYCVDSCEGPSDCLDGGARTGTLTCARMSFMGFVGFDSIPGTTDDKLFTGSFCSGAACTSDLDCSSDGSARCVPDVDPSDAGKNLILRCRPATTAVATGGSSCNFDNGCASGVCGELQSPSTGSGKACFEACTASTVCPTGMSCRVGGMRVGTIAAQLSFDSCAP
jgi:hypothetical protein